MRVGDRLGHGEKAGEILKASEVRWGGRKRERGVGPGQ